MGKSLNCKNRQKLLHKMKKKSATDSCKTASRKGDLKNGRSN